MRQRTPFGIGRTGRHKLDVGETAAGQYALRGMIQIVQPGAGASWWPKVVVPQSSRAGAPPTIEAVGGRRVMLHPELTTICVPREMLPLPDCRQISEPPVSLGLSLNEQEFLETAPAEALAQALKQLVATILPHYFRSIKTTAEIAGLHPRAL